MVYSNTRITHIRSLTGEYIRISNSPENPETTCVQY